MIAGKTITLVVGTTCEDYTSNTAWEAFVMLDPVIIRRIREEERRRKQLERIQPQIPVYYEPEPLRPPKREEDEKPSGGCVIEIDL